MTQQHEGGGPAPSLVCEARVNLGAAAEAVGRLGRILDGAVSSTPAQRRHGKDEDDE